MQCYYCGKETSTAGKFCGKCGVALGANEEIVRAAQDNDEKPITSL